MSINEELVVQYQATKDKEVLEKILLNNKNLIYDIAKRFYNKNADIDLDDLFCEGRIGMIGAVKKFDVSKGYLFSTFASHQIEGYIRHYLRDKCKMIQLPTLVGQKTAKLDRLIKLHNLPCDVTSVQLNMATGLSMDECEDLLSANKHKVQVISYDIALNKSDNEDTILDLLCEKPEDFNIEERRQECKAIIQEYLSGAVTMVSLANKYKIKTLDVKNIVTNRHLFGFTR